MRKLEGSCHHHTDHSCNSILPTVRFCCPRPGVCVQDCSYPRDERLLVLTWTCREEKYEPLISFSLREGVPAIPAGSSSASPGMCSSSRVPGAGPPTTSALLHCPILCHGWVRWKHPSAGFGSKHWATHTMELSSTEPWEWKTSTTKVNKKINYYFKKLSDISMLIYFPCLSTSWVTKNWSQLWCYANGNCCVIFLSGKITQVFRKHHHCHSPLYIPDFILQK